MACINFLSVPGEGVRGTVGGKDVLIGNQKFMRNVSNYKK